MQNNSNTFVVTVIWKSNGNKWHPTIKGDNPNWPVLETESKLYKVGARQLKSCDQTMGNIEVKPYTEIEDGINVRSTYMCVRLYSVSSVLFRVEM